MAKQISSIAGSACPGPPRADCLAEVQLVAAILWGVDPLNTQHSTLETLSPTQKIRHLNQTAKQEVVVAQPELACAS